MRDRDREKCLSISVQSIPAEGLNGDVAVQAANNVMSDKKVVDSLIIFFKPMRFVTGSRFFSLA